jgi:hypothetical protein
MVDRTIQLQHRNKRAQCTTEAWNEQAEAMNRAQNRAMASRRNIPIQA